MKFYMVWNQAGTGFEVVEKLGRKQRPIAEVEAATLVAAQQAFGADKALKTKLRALLARDVLEKAMYGDIPYTASDKAIAKMAKKYAAEPRRSVRITSHEWYVAEGALEAPMDGVYFELVNAIDGVYFEWTTFMSGHWYTNVLPAHQPLPEWAVIRQVSLDGKWVAVCGEPRETRQDCDMQAWLASREGGW